MRRLSDDTEVVAKAINDVKTSYPNKSGRGAEPVWENDSLRCYVPPLKCIIPERILILMRSIELRLPLGRVEFGAFLKGSLHSDSSLRLSEDFIVVKQKVTGASIDFLEDPPDGFNGVIHRHPSGCKNFSGNPKDPGGTGHYCDAGSINQNHDFSLLYVDNHITKGIINLKTIEGVRIQVELNPTILYPVDISSVSSFIEKIEKDNTQIEQDNKRRGFHPMNNLLPQHLSLNSHLSDDDDDDVPHNISKSDDDYTVLDDNNVYARCDNCDSITEIIIFPCQCPVCGEVVGDDSVIDIDEISIGELVHSQEV